VFFIKGAEFRLIVSLMKRVKIIIRLMHRSLSKLLQEMQASAAKKLGVLENAINDEYTEQESLTEQAEDKWPTLSFTNNQMNLLHPSSERLTLQEFQIW
jgi:tetrahydromethanopterin S-methyltransferase subunit C